MFAGGSVTLFLDSLLICKFEQPACMKWRIESDVEQVFKKGEEGLQDEQGFLHQLKSGKAYLHGSDRSGRPVSQQSQRRVHSH